ncbi:restriction endonuclease [Flavobacteriaceae bacterium MAR_2009_75]|nr:restriction endonuclease [Flavobacteriaceae bacterium MAR_2009_75]
MSKKWSIYRRYKALGLWNKVFLWLAIIGIVIGGWQLYLAYNPPTKLVISDEENGVLEQNGAKPNEVAELINIIQADRNKAIDDVAQIEFIDIISNIYKSLDSTSTIILNQIHVDSITGIEYRSDVLIEKEILGTKIKLLLRLNPYENPIGESEILNFQNHIEKIRASKGVIITKGKYRKAAVKFADAYSIDLATFQSSIMDKWAEKMEIPVVVKIISVQSVYNLKFKALAAEQKEINPKFTKILYKESGEHFIMDLFIRKWNEGHIYKPGDNKKGVIDFYRPNAKIQLVPSGAWHECQEIMVDYSIEESYKFSYLQPKKYTELLKVSNDQLIYWEMEFNKSQFDELNNWRTIRRIPNYYKNISRKLTIVKMNYLDRSTILDEDIEWHFK